MREITFVITTRNLPMYWESAFLLEIDRNLIDADIRELYNPSYYFDEESNKVIVKFKETDSDNENKYTVYVAPCMLGSDNSKLDAQWRNCRFAFLEKLLIEVEKIEEQATIEKEVYLIAHDKDFGENADNILYQPQRTIPKMYVTLNKLVDNHRVFLFQHEDGEIYRNVSGLIDSVFDNSCDALYIFMRTEIDYFENTFCGRNSRRK